MSVDYHPYRGDGWKDADGKDRCLDCNLPQANARHAAPTTHPDVARHEARRLGEKE